MYTDFQIWSTFCRRHPNEWENHRQETHSPRNFHIVTFFSFYIKRIVCLLFESDFSIFAVVCFQSYRRLAYAIKQTTYQFIHVSFPWVWRMTEVRKNRRSRNWYFGKLISCNGKKKTLVTLNCSYLWTQIKSFFSYIIVFFFISHSAHVINSWIMHLKTNCPFFKKMMTPLLTISIVLQLLLKNKHQSTIAEYQQYFICSRIALQASTFFCRCFSLIR